MCSIVDDALTMLDEKKCGVLLLLDQSAAFDTVVHSLLIDDLRGVGIDGSALGLLKDYLTNRKYSVQIGNEFSEERLLERGVPQGSVLGPILFCIYTRELANILMSLGVQFKLFADDTHIYLYFVNVEVSSNKINEVCGEMG